jgi:hypothetical protein
MVLTDGESHSGLMDRISHKAGLSKTELTSVLEGKDGGSLVYEWESGKWSLEDGKSLFPLRFSIFPRPKVVIHTFQLTLNLDDDLQILQSRLPATSSEGVTLHLTPPHARAHFANSPPAYTTASNSIKAKAQSKPAKSALSKSNGTGKEDKKETTKGSGFPDLKALPNTADYANKTNENSPPGKAGNLLGPPASSATTNTTSIPPSPGKSSAKSKGKRVTSNSSSTFAKMEEEVGKTADGSVIGMPKGEQGTWGRVEKARSVSGKSLGGASRKSKWDVGDDVESWGDVHKRMWIEVSGIS